MFGQRKIFLLPNLITMAALFCGFYSILLSADGRYHHSAFFIFIAMIFDGFDGRVARWTKSESNFGVQFDSLSDLISFGVAPAMLMYQWVLNLANTTSYLPSKIGWMAAFIYAACAALRLARFNTQVSIVDKKIFIGLPSPAAAGVIAGFVWLGNNYDWPQREIIALSVVMMICCGLAMISNIRYLSGKSLKLEGKVPFIAAIIPVLFFGFLFLEPVAILFAVFTIYALHGPILAILRFYRKSRKADKNA